MPTGLGLRPGAKAPDEPPNPTGYAPPLDSTGGRCRREVVVLGTDQPPERGMNAKQREEVPRDPGHLQFLGGLAARPFSLRSGAV